MTRLESLTQWLLKPLWPEIDARIFRPRGHQWPALLRMANWRKREPDANDFSAMIDVINMVLNWRQARLKSQGNRPFPPTFEEEMIRRAEEQLRRANYVEEISREIKEQLQKTNKPYTFEK